MRPTTPQGDPARAYPQGSHVDHAAEHRILRELDRGVRQGSDPTTFNEAAAAHARLAHGSSTHWPADYREVGL